MGKLLRACLVVCFLLLTSACATITRGTNDTVVIETDPPTADVRLSNGLTCKTPCSLKMKRKDACVVKIEKEGYEPVEVNLTPQISGGGSAGMAGNVLVGGLIGAAIDVGSGAMYDLKPNPITVRLIQISPVPPVTPSDMSAKDPPEAVREKTVSERLKECDELKEKGAITDDEYSRLRQKILLDL